MSRRRRIAFPEWNRHRYQLVQRSTAPIQTEGGSLDNRQLPVKMNVPAATAAIALTNPLRTRLVSTAHRPDVTIVVTTETTAGAETLQDRPRKARKPDLSQYSEAAYKTNISIDKSRSKETMLTLGGSEETQLPSSQPSLPREAVRQHVDGGVVYYVQCPECNKRLKQKSYKSHLRTHAGVKQHHCDLCGDRFTRKNDVIRHKKLIHEKPRDYKCSQCDKFFVTLENMKSHQVKHSQEMRCKVCQHGFGKKEYYENHVKFVHPDGGNASAKTLSNKLQKSTSDIKKSSNIIILGEGSKISNKTPEIQSSKVQQVLQSDRFFIVEETEEDSSQVCSHSFSGIK